MFTCAEVQSLPRSLAALGEAWIDRWRLSFRCRCSARAKIMAEIAIDLGYGEAACSDPGQLARPMPEAGTPDPGVPSFKKPKVVAAASQVSSLKDEEDKEKINWAARLKRIAEKARSAAQINSSLGGDLSPEEQSQIKGLVFRSGPFRTIRLHVLAWERMEKWAVDHGLSVYPPSTQVVTKYFMALQASGCGPAVLPALRQAVRWICKRLVMTAPDTGDPALEAIVAKVYEDRGKELKEAVPVPLKAVAAHFGGQDPRRNFCMVDLDLDLCVVAMGRRKTCSSLLAGAHS